MAQMITDLLQNIYNRIAQLGQEIQNLKASLDALNKNIEEKIANLTAQLEEFQNEIDTTKGKYLETVKDMGGEVTSELMKLQEGLGLKDLEKLIENMENFAKLSEEVLSQDTVNLLLSEAINSVKGLKKSMSE
ncbi:MAG: hypothetical protein EU544_03230 [Promethearchaeota archaeon]|nr:MAG: hypothetical protein EU544_03230 [Candidatus Lokiarchaeota archaeon]